MYEHAPFAMQLGSFRLHIQTILFVLIYDVNKIQKIRELYSKERTYDINGHIDQYKTLYKVF